MERKFNRLDTNKVKKGDLMVTINWVRVDQAFKDRFVGQDLDNKALNQLEVRGTELVQTCFSANQFAQEEKVTKTEAAELLVSSFNRPFTVCFEKQGGEERVLVGRLVKSEHLLGRSHVEDLEITSGHRLRLVDHRSIKYLIVDGTKYTVKK